VTASIAIKVDSNWNKENAGNAWQQNIPVVELVGHTLVDSTVSLDVDNIANLVGLQVGGKLDGHTMFAEVASEHMAGASADTERVRHVESILEKLKRENGISPP
jgi:hypothetical protein